ncbi:hypothetical protein ACFLXD_04910 [Chloroflexota bacterium]
MKKVANKPLKNIQTVKTRRSSTLQNIVLDWFSKNGRDFPWRNTNNAFFILIAESLLRQTQAERVVEPYLNLISIFQDPQSMFQANVIQLREWFHPLGLVRRADCLVETSKILICDFNGKVPDHIEQLKELPGLGEYSSRAVLCLAYNAQVPMVDESSGRLLRRIFNLRSERPAYSDHKLLELARKLLPKGLARSFNLGLIDIAAVYCHSKNPECSPCPLVSLCSYGQDCGV